MAALRLRSWSQQRQQRFLDGLLAELSHLLARRCHGGGCSVRRRHYVALLEHQAACLGTARRQQQQQQGEGGAEEEEEADFKFEGLRLVQDDGVWLELQQPEAAGPAEEEGRRLWVRDRGGWPAVQAGLPLRYRLLRLVHAHSLHRRLPGGWQEHRWRESKQLGRGENRVWYSPVSGQVTCQPPPPPLTLAPFLHASLTAADAYDDTTTTIAQPHPPQQPPPPPHPQPPSASAPPPSSDAPHPPAPQQPAPAPASSSFSSSPVPPPLSMQAAPSPPPKPLPPPGRPPVPPGGLLKPLSQSHLTATIVNLLRKPRPSNRRSVVAVCGFALLLVQGELFSQALPALQRAVALALAQQDHDQHHRQQQQQADAPAAAALRAKGRRGAKHRKHHHARVTPRQRAQLQLALARLCLLAADFRGADQAAKLAVGSAPRDADVLAGAGDVLMHLCRWDEAEPLLLAALLREPGCQAAHRSYARLCAARGHADFAHHYYQRAVQARARSYPEAAETCLEYGLYLLEPWEAKVPEAERYLRQALSVLQARGQQPGFGLAFAPPLPARGRHDVDTQVSADVCFAMGRLYHLHRRDSHKAADYYSEALRLNPHHTHALLHQACLLATSRLPEDLLDADALFRRAFSLPAPEPQQAGLLLLPRLLYAHFLATSTMADHAHAETQYVRAMAALSSLSLPGVALAGMLEQQAYGCSVHRALGRRLSQHVAAAHRQDALALVARAMAMVGKKTKGAEQEALSLLDEALRLTRDSFGPALRAKGLLLAHGWHGHAPDPTGALKLFLRGLDVLPSSVTLLRTSAIHLLLHMPLGKARATGEAGKGGGPGQQQSKEQESPGHEQLVAYLTRAIALEPNDVPTLVACALCRLRRGQAEDGQAAEALLRKAAQAASSPTERARCLRLLGLMHYDQQQLDKAADLFRSALKAQPSDPVACVALGACLAAAGDGLHFDGPEQLFQRAWPAGCCPGAEQEEGKQAQQGGQGVAADVNSSFCHVMYGLFKLQHRYDRRAARALLLAAAQDKRRPPNCLALYHLGRLAQLEDKLADMEKWMVWALETEPTTFLQVGRGATHQPGRQAGEGE